MKSLEIVNEEIRLIESELQKIENEEDSLLPFDTLMYELERCSKIKQDLEVLDIIRKKKVDVEYLTYALESYDSLEDVLNCYNTSIDYHLTMEELLKLKQWLEENENDM